MSFTSAAVTIYEPLSRPMRKWSSLGIMGLWVVVWRGVSPALEDLDTPGALAGVVKRGGQSSRALLGPCWPYPISWGRDVGLVAFITMLGEVGVVWCNLWGKGDGGGEQRHTT